MSDYYEKFQQTLAEIDKQTNEFVVMKSELERFEQSDILDRLVKMNKTAEEIEKRLGRSVSVEYNSLSFGRYGSRCVDITEIEAAGGDRYYFHLNEDGLSFRCWNHLKERVAGYLEPVDAFSDYRITSSGFKCLTPNRDEDMTDRNKPKVYREVFDIPVGDFKYCSVSLRDFSFDSTVDEWQKESLKQTEIRKENGVSLEDERTALQWFFSNVVSADKVAALNNGFDGLEQKYYEECDKALKEFYGKTAKKAPKDKGEER